MAVESGGWRPWVLTGTDMPLNVSPLDSLNNNLCLDLNNVINLALGDDNEANPYIDFKLSTNYHDEISFINNFSGPNNKIMLSLNIRSLMCNHDRLLALVEKLTSKGVNIIAIAIQETWAVPYPDLVQIPNYNFFMKSRSKGRGGGVGFYTLNSYRCKIIEELSPFTDKEFESITVELSQNNKKLLLCNIYRSPTQLHCQSNTVQIENFITKFDELLQSLYQCNSNVFAFLDANINLLKVANSKHASDYIGTIHSNGFLQLISKATRISGDSYSLIDHILCKNFDQSYKTSTLIADISDHHRWASLT